MKILYCIICISLSLNALAQTSDTTKKSTYIVDGQPRASISDIKPGDILEVNIPTDKANAGITIIITKKYAITQYQQKFCTLNKKYKEYFDKKHSDDNLAYVIDNVILTNGRKSTVERLYALRPEEIDQIIFKRDSHFTTDATVVIATKQ
jgi:TusA-related sulfurtransferase